MMVFVPEVLHERKNEWYFSEEQPWKPIAKENASDEVKRAIDEFVEAIENED